MKNGAAKMACGRVVMLGDAEIGKRLLVEVLNIGINDELSQASANMTTENQSQCLRRVLQNGRFCTITEEEENKELVLSVYKFMKDNPGSILNTVTPSKFKMIKAFYDPSTPSYTEETAEDAISEIVKKLITNIMEMTGFVQQGEPRTSVLLHASSFSSNDKLWDLLPVFVTPRILFFLPFNAAGKSVDQFDECDRDEYYKRIALIYGSLGKKAKELHGRR